MLKDILTLSGFTGLYKLVSHGKNTTIVESIVDGKRIPAYSNTRINSLEDISIYLENGGDTTLTEVLILIFENKIEVNPKADDLALKETFKQILPNFDPERVYISHIKKIFAWYNILIEKEIITEETILNYKKLQEEEKAKEEEEKAKEEGKETENEKAEEGAVEKSETDADEKSNFVEEHLEEVE
ncbi:MAG: DUF5606 domain-containing protein [Marinilabiliaceae bacterium]|nr:DUF5606 domain-containing protein [Marinilabiliaceae bacterium]